MKFQLEKNFEKVSFLKMTRGDRWGLVWGGDGAPGTPPKPSLISQAPGRHWLQRMPPPTLPPSLLPFLPLSLLPPPFPFPPFSLPLLLSFLLFFPPSLLSPLLIFSSPSLLPSLPFCLSFPLPSLPSLYPSLSFLLSFPPSLLSPLISSFLPPFLLPPPSFSPPSLSLPSYTVLCALRYRTWYLSSLMRVGHIRYSVPHFFLHQWESLRVTWTPWGDPCLLLSLFRQSLGKGLSVETTSLLCLLMA